MRHRGGAVGAAIIDDDNFIREIARNLTNHLPNRVFFVERRHYHRYKRSDPAWGSCLAHMLQGATPSGAVTFSLNFCRRLPSENAIIKKKGTNTTALILK